MTMENVGKYDLDTVKRKLKKAMPLLSPNLQVLADVLVCTLMTQVGEGLSFMTIDLYTQILHLYSLFSFVLLLLLLTSRDLKLDNCILFLLGLIFRAKIGKF